jgi:hypothetical protein
MAVKSFGVTERGMTLLATATPSAATGISFTNIPTFYKHLMIIWRDTYASSTSGFGVRLNNDTTAGRHSYRNLGMTASATVGRDTGTSTFFTSDNNERFVIPRQTATPASRNLLGYGTFTVYRYTENEPKFCEWNGSGDTGSSFGNGQFEGTAAITQVDFVRSSTQTINGTFYLYGVS